MDVVESWTEFGHTFKIERLSPPVRVGAGLRHYRLHDNGHPATGGQWHYTLEGARARAQYVLAGDYVGRIAWLENRVNVLERELAHARWFGD